jgi:hypothetical protein
MISLVRVKFLYYLSFAKGLLRIGSPLDRRFTLLALLCYSVAELTQDKLTFTTDTHCVRNCALQDKWGHMTEAGEIKLIFDFVAPLDIFYPQLQTGVDTCAPLFPYRSY